MKKIVYSILATIAGLVLLFSYRTSLDQPTASPLISGTKTTTTGGATPSAKPSASPTPSATASPSSGESSDDGSASSGSSSSGSSGSSGGSTSQSSSGLKDGTYTGRVSYTRYGPMQVRISVSSGVITRVDVPQYPNSSGQDHEINSYAIPQLVDETVTAQSAQIDMVSGATYTSQGYLDSLQSAIDKARA